MYDKLVKRCKALRDYNGFIPYSMIQEAFDCVAEAADAIEEMSAKATPKRVGFTEWKGCRNTRYKCPLCTKYVRNDEKYCHMRGQALMFPIISFTPYVHGKQQETIISWPDETPKEAQDA